MKTGSQAKAITAQNVGTLVSRVQQWDSEHKSIIFGEYYHYMQQTHSFKPFPYFGYKKENFSNP